MDKGEVTLSVHDEGFAVRASTIDGTLIYGHLGKAVERARRELKLMVEKSKHGGGGGL